MPCPQRNQINSVKTIRNSRKIMHAPGAIVGNHYQIIQKLGRDGLGRTYLAKNLQAQADSRCAIEQIQPQLNSPEAWANAQQRLVEEVAVLQRLGDHPQIPRFWTYFIEDGYFYLVREYVEGESLQVLISRQVGNEAQGIHLLQDVLRILDFAHKINVIHRALNPAHIIQRRGDGNFVLINFGAIAELEARETDFTGTWGYIPPEQQAGNPGYSSDLYALGKIVIYALTGRSPREFETTKTNWQHNCQISDKLGEIVNKMGTPAVRDRYNSALEVLYDLKPLLKIERVVGGRYRITRYLGGKNGINTYLADNLRRHYQSPCLIKQVELPDSDPATWAKIERRFAEELILLERLGYHDQIPQLWDHFEEQDEFYLVQEYIQGENLEQILQQRKLELVEVIELLQNTMSVLAFVHQHHAIHRNLKPSNLMIRQSDGAVVLTDFGILADIKSVPHTTEKTTQAANPERYLPPEQIAGRPTVSSDLYALGMIAIEAMSGTKPKDLTRERNTGVILWPKEGMRFNRRLDKFICKMTNLDVGQRYQSVEAAVEDLYKINLPRHKSAVEKLNLPQTRPILSRQEQRWFKPIHLVIGGVGLLCLLASMEFAFPTLRPFYYNVKGKQLLSEQPQTALGIFMKAIDLKPTSFSAWEGRADALYELKEFPKALEAYYEAIQLNTKDAQIWKKKADVLFVLERYHEALIAYDRALQLQPDDKATIYKQGKTLYQLQRYPEALKAQDKVLEFDPLNAQYLSARAQTLIALERYYDALTVLNQVQAITPFNPQLWQNKSLSLEHLERPEEARRVIRDVIATYDKIIAQNPQNADFLLDKADFLSQSQMPQKALEAYDAAIDLDPNFYAAWLGKAQALLYLGEYDVALTAINEAIRISPKSYLAWQVLGNIYQQKNNNLTEAIAAYERAIEINPNYASLWRNLGVVLREQGKYNRAIESLTKASAINPQDSDNWLDLAITLNAAGKDEQALAALDRALEVKPQDPAIWRKKGAIFIEKRQYNEACETYRQSRTVTPEDSAILDSMRMLGCHMQ